MTDSTRPAVVTWQNLYCFALGAVYVLGAAGGVAMMVFRRQLADPEMSPNETLFMGLLVAAMGAVLAVPFLAAPFLPRRRWVWILHIVLIAIGMTSCACLPATVPLLVFWIRPETQAWFA